MKCVRNKYEKIEEEEEKEEPEGDSLHVENAGFWILATFCQTSKYFAILKSEA